MNENWPRWIFASVSKHMDAHRNGLRMFIEGLDHVEGVDDYIELRIDGPYVLELSKDYFRLNCEINVFISSARNHKDFHKLYRDQGIVLKALGQDIKVFKLGDGVDDDQSQLGCLILANSGDAREALRVSNFGQISTDLPIVRSSVEGHYHIELHG